MILNGVLCTAVYLGEVVICWRNIWIHSKIFADSPMEKQPLCWANDKNPTITFNAVFSFVIFTANRFTFGVCAVGAGVGVGAADTFLFFGCMAAICALNCACADMVAVTACLPVVCDTGLFDACSVLADACLVVVSSLVTGASNFVTSSVCNSNIVIYYSMFVFWALFTRNKTCEGVHAVKFMNRFFYICRPCNGIIK